MKRQERNKEKDERERNVRELQQVVIHHLNRDHTREAPFHCGDLNRIDREREGESVTNCAALKFEQNSNTQTTKKPIQFKTPTNSRREREREREEKGEGN